MAPKYEAAAKILSESSLEIARLDGSQEDRATVDLMASVDLEAFPSFHFFVSDGKDVGSIPVPDEEFNADDVVQFVEAMQTVPINMLTKANGVRMSTGIKKAPFAVLAVYNDLSPAALEQYRTPAQVLKCASYLTPSIPFFATEKLKFASSKLIKAINKVQPQTSWFSQAASDQLFLINNDAEEVHVVAPSALSNFTELARLVKEAGSPLVWEFTPENQDEVTAEGSSNFVWVYVERNSRHWDEYKTALKATSLRAREAKEDWKFVMVSDEQVEALEYFGISQNDLPKVMIMDVKIEQGGQRQFQMPDKHARQMTGDSGHLVDFMDQYKAGKLERFYRSAPAPKQAADVQLREVVGVTFRSDVLERSAGGKDTLVYFYSKLPWKCEECSSFKSTFRALCKSLAHVKSLDCAQIDQPNNEIRWEDAPKLMAAMESAELPVVVLFPAATDSAGADWKLIDAAAVTAENGEGDKPVPTKATLKKLLRTHAHHAFQLDGVRYGGLSEAEQQDITKKFVVQLTADNFGARVMESDADVLVEWYAPWCGHCKHLAAPYEELAKKHASKKRLVVAKIDGSMHAPAVQALFLVRVYLLLTCLRYLGGHGQILGSKTTQGAVSTTPNNSRN
jgi:thiol-disulfide isomerase/thioredoxin